MFLFQSYLLQILHYKEFIDDAIGRELFNSVIREIASDFEDGSYEKDQANSLIERLENPHETFDFFGCTRFISKYTGAEFGEGAEAIKRLLKNKDLKDFLNNYAKGIVEDLEFLCEEYSPDIAKGIFEE